MPAFTTFLGLAAIAGSLVSAAPVEIRGSPNHYASAYLEDYDTYHVRYLAAGCTGQQGTDFFEACCHPLLKTESVAADLASYCVPNATAVSAAAAWVSSTSAAGVATLKYTAVTTVPTVTASSTAASTTTAEAAYAEPQASSSSAYVAPTTSTSVYVAPTTSTTPAYVAPTTSTSVYVAPTTSTTPAYVAPTTTAAASTGSSVQSGGYATYFYQNGNAGACGQYHGDYDYLVAIDSAWWPNMGTQSSYCGKSLTIKNTNNGKTVSAYVADVCPTCTNGNSLDLSVGAFQAIASLSDGLVPITWWWN